MFLPPAIKAKLAELAAQPGAQSADLFNLQAALRLCNELAGDMWTPKDADDVVRLLGDAQTGASALVLPGAAATERGR